MFEIKDNVRDFLRNSCEIVGNYESHGWELGVTSIIYDKIQSPIEQILYMAIQVLLHINGIEPMRQHDYQGKICWIGFFIDSQFEIGKYRTDFAVLYTNSPFDKGRKLIVECDSQEFHDRSERERRYEKARDRFIQSNGYKVFRYTGSEICKEPYRVASEIIAEVYKDLTKEELLSSLENWKPS